MAVGDLITENYQFEYDGVLIGQGDVEVTRIQGVYSSPSIRSNDNNRPLRDGVFVGNDYYAERIITLDIEVWGQTPEEMTSNLQDLMAATAIRNREAALVMRLAGWTDDMIVFARPRERGGFDIIRDTVLGYVTRGSIRFVASNPRLLLGTTTNKEVVATTIDDPIIGLVFDALADIVFESGTFSGSTVITNNGTADANVLLTTVGAVTNPKITATFPDGTSKVLELISSYSATDTVEFESDRRTILRNNFVGSGAQLNQYRHLVDSTQWFDLPPGDTTITYEGTSSGGLPELCVEWRDTYI